MMFCPLSAELPKYNVVLKTTDTFACIYLDFWINGNLERMVMELHEKAAKSVTTVRHCIYF